MFQRVAYEQWHDFVPYIAFATTALVFTVMSVRGLWLRKDQSDHLSNLPLDD
jgi:FtsH-binding integral membrane protein